LVLSGLIFRQLSAQSAPLLLAWVFMGLSITALMLVRSEDGPIGIQSAGQPLSLLRMVQVLGFLALTLALGIWISLVVPRPAQRLFIFLEPAYRVFLLVVQLVVALGAIIGAELGRRLFGFLGVDFGATFSESWNRIRALLEELGALLGINFDLFDRIPAWVWTVLDVLVWISAIVIVLGGLLLALRVVQRYRTRRDGEETGSEDLLPTDLFRRGLTQLRSLFNLVRQYGINRQLLAAISVQNIYANLCRMAARRGYPRPVALPPGRYLHQLEVAFVDCAVPLARITDAYLRVHYGDKTITREVLAQIQAAYREVRESGNGEQG